VASAPWLLRLLGGAAFCLLGKPQKFWQFAPALFSTRLEVDSPAWGSSGLQVFLSGSGFELLAFRSPLAI